MIYSIENYEWDGFGAGMAGKVRCDPAGGVAEQARRQPQYELECGCGCGVIWVGTTWTLPPRSPAPRWWGVSEDK